VTSRFRRCAPAVFAGACVCLLSACLENYEEDMVINADLSGRVVVRVKLPDVLLTKFDAVRAEFAPKNVEKRFDAASGVSLKSYTLTEERFPQATFDVAFSSLDKLSAAAAANPPVQMLVGAFSVKTADGGRTVIERKLGRGKATAELPADKFAQFKMHFQLPVEILSTDSGFKDTSQNDVRYRWSLADIAAQKPVMLNAVETPTQWLWILGGVGGLLVVAWLGWLAFG
jgi:hypothetical protein